MLPQPRVFRPEELHPGLTAEFEKLVTAEDILAFARNSGDMNPLHVDEEYAASTNFGKRVAHGAYQVGLASALIGMYLPGRDVLLVSTNAQFLQPLYFPSQVRVRGEITTWSPASLRGSLRVVVSTLPAEAVVSEIHLGFTFHEHREGEQLPRSIASQAAIARRSENVPASRILVTGASGGVGSALIAALADDYQVIALINRGSLPEFIGNHPNVSTVRADFSQPGWELGLGSAIGLEPLYAIVHAAWPGMPHGGLLKVPPEVVAQQVGFGAVQTVALARILAERAASTGGRFIALSSIVGTHKPVLSLAAYSLGKAVLENTIRLLAPELALKKITANAICPTFMPAGMNQQANARQRMVEAASVPMGRLCDTTDVISFVQYLLSDAGSFLSGESVALAGGQLL